MARSSDIEFGKLALVLGFTHKENVYSAIRETALLQELGINKRLPHIMYEHDYLTPVQIQAILWALYKNRHMRRFPARVVYEFSEDDDQNFLQKVALPMNFLLESVKSSDEFLLVSDTEQDDEKSPFPQDVLIYCLDLQKQLEQKGFSRSLLSILSSKGHLHGEYRKLVPDIDNKKKVLSSPLQAKNPMLRRLWETVLFSAWAVQKSKLNDKQVEMARKIWGQAIEQFKLSLKFSEILGYLSYMSKGDLTKLGVFVAEFANLDQIPRFHMFDLDDEERSFIHSHLRQHPKYQKAYRSCVRQAEQLKGLHLNIPPEELLIHRGHITRAKISEARKKVKRSTGSFDLVSTAEYKLSQDLSRRFAGRRETSLSKRQKKELANKMIPFSVDSVEKEFESRYLEERKAARVRQPEQEIQSIIKELSHTQLMAFKEIAFSPTEDSPLQGGQIPKWRPKTAQDLKPQEHTEYISLDEEEIVAGNKDRPLPDLQEMEQTGYISLDASANEIRQLSQTIVEKLEQKKFTGKMLLALFIVATGVALIEPKFKQLFDHISQERLALYTGLSMFMVFLPAMFFGELFGKLADRGQVHWLYFWGFCIFGLSLIPLPFFKDIYTHCAVRFIQGIGLAAIFVGAEYCVGRWYGPLERGKTMGLAMMVFSSGFCIGFLLPDMLAGIGKVFGMSALLFSSIIWAFVAFAMIPITFKIRIAPPSGEDVEEEAGEETLAKKPLIAAALYGITEMGLFAIFFPCYPKEVHLAGDIISTELLILLFGAGAFFSSYLLGWLSDRIGAAPILTMLSLIAVVAFCMLPLPFISTSMVHLCFLSLGIVLGGLAPLGFSWLLELTDDDRYVGAASGAFSKYQGAGSMFGCLFCGLLFFLFGKEGFLLFLSMVFVAYFYLLITSIKPRGFLHKSGRLGGILSLLEPSEP